jgi:hypothetical protein
MPDVLGARGIESTKQRLSIISKEDKSELAFELLKLVREVYLTRQNKERTLLTEID